MPIITSNIKFFLSGGGSNTDPNASLGGAISSTEITNIINNLFDDVTGDESAAGSVEYRAFYVKNTHATLTWIQVRHWIQTNTPAGDDIAIGIEAVKGSPKQTVANTTTLPTGITFSTPVNKATALTLGNLAPGEVYMVWVKRNVPSGTPAYNNDTFTLRFEGDSMA